MFKALGSHCESKLTATAGTPITALFPPRRGAFTRLIKMLYLAGATAHTLTVLKCLGKTTLSAAAASSATTVVLTADPGTGTPASGIATNDWIAVQLDDGTFFLAKATGVSTLTITVAALPAGAAAGNNVYFFGAPADHASSQTNPKVNNVVGSAFTCTASVLKDFSDVAAGLHMSLNQNEPIMVYSDNATAAGELQQATAVYTSN